jgi:hypothetical protein
MDGGILSLAFSNPSQRRTLIHVFSQQKDIEFYHERVKKG